MDNLSKQEARTIAARLVRRVQAKVALSEDKAKALEAGWADAVARCFIGSLDNSTIGAFQEAIAKGLLPVADDKEETKSRTPDCCSLKSTTKS